MKKIGLLLITFLCVTALFGCGRQQKGDYVIKNKGFKNIVTFDANGGSFSKDSTIRYEYTTDNGYLVEPGKNSSVIDVASRPGYSLVGWFTGTKDQDGTVNYDSMAFDFNNDTVNSSFTLYAKWIENYSFSLINVYVDLRTGEKTYDEESINKSCINYFRFNELYGTVNNFNKSGYSFVNLYKDYDLTMEIDDTYVHPCEEKKCTLYAKWYIGQYKKVYSINDLSRVSSSTSLIIMNDIDFTDSDWLIGNLAIYSGYIIGNNYAFKNISLSFIDKTQKNNYGLFSELNNAIIEDLTFQNCTVKIKFTKDFTRTSLVKYVGFLAGTIKNSTLKNVTFENATLAYITQESFTNIHKTINEPSEPFYYGSTDSSLIELNGSIIYANND